MPLLLLIMALLLLLALRYRGGSDAPRWNKGVRLGLRTSAVRAVGAVGAVGLGALAVVAGAGTVAVGSTIGLATGSATLCATAPLCHIVCIDQHSPRSPPPPRPHNT